MADGSALVPPPLADFPEAWWASAELSCSPARPGRIGLSVFLPTLAELERLAARFPECAGLSAEESTLRDALILIPRFWVKLTFEGNRVVGVSQYFQVSDTVDYPISSLRFFGRRYGAADVDRLEDTLRPELERPGTVWGLVLRHGEGPPRPRYSVRVPREGVAPLLDRLVEAGFAAPACADTLLGVDVDNPAPRYVTWTPDDPAACALDFEDVDASAVPEIASLPPGVRWRYVKARPTAGDVEWTGYVGWSDLQPAYDALPPADYVRAVRAYYDDTAELVQGVFGDTYQAGWLGESSADSNRYVAERAELEAGQRVLDAGSGLGGPAADIRAAVPGIRVTGITLSEAQARMSGALAGDFHDLPFADASFDVVLFLESAGYAWDLGRVFREARRVTAPGGLLYVKDVVRLPGTGSERQLREWERTYRFRTRTPEELARAAQASGFEGIEVTNLSPMVTMEHWSRAMTGSDGTLTPFGERHFRMAPDLPLAWAELKARRG